MTIRFELSDKLDRFGIPQASVMFNWGANELKMREDIASQARQMLEAAGASRVHSSSAIKVPGASVHEMGTARMGRDPASSVLNGFKPGPRSSKPVCDRWCLHDVFVLRQPLPYLYGADGQGGGSCSESVPDLVVTGGRRRPALLPLSLHK